eukprot:gnl/Dysnectes_brevis/3555_a4518_759.p2 GENE.gnl/Dysnectes_brevis/3555_a4518_759~~gnl/Dysnectes_brevis/3555_a4518_759.p2  ORF type:complete len:227 (+),score=61.08 gnl/Dysnectes_brevis/3555_a4518_759:932-1612(+)
MKSIKVKSVILHRMIIGGMCGLVAYLAATLHLSIVAAVLSPHRTLWSVLKSVHIVPSLCPYASQNRAYFGMMMMNTMPFLNSFFGSRISNPLAAEALSLSVANSACNLVINAIFAFYTAGIPGLLLAIPKLRKEAMVNLMAMPARVGAIKLARKYNLSAPLQGLMGGVATGAALWALSGGLMTRAWMGLFMKSSTVGVAVCANFTMRGYASRYVQLVKGKKVKGKK